MTISFSFSTLVVTVVVLAALTALGYIGVCYYRVTVRRAHALRHTPQPDEIWVQGETILYIDYVTPIGVEWMTIDPRSKSVIKHRDTWNEWQQRLMAHNMWFTGQRRPLGSA